MKPWDVISEVVKLNSYPPPRNPFAVDFDYFASIPACDVLTATGAMIHFLHKVILTDTQDHFYTAKGY